MKALHTVRNRYGGIIITPDKQPEDNGAFIQTLERSLLNWRKEKIKVVWLTLAIHRSELLPALYRLNFENHHCDSKSLTLTLRLDAGAVIPPFANHTIGVGGLVINSQNEVLTIRELAHIQSHPHNWKFPGGMLDPFEHFESGVKREVFEETGIQTEFESFIGFRHHHVGQFTTSNIYAVCRLTPLSHEIKIQESEIYDARWFPIDDYLADDKIGKYNQYILKSALRFPGLKSVKLPDYMASETDYEVFLS